MKKVVCYQLEFELKLVTPSFMQEPTEKPLKIYSCCSALCRIHSLTTTCLTPSPSHPHLQVFEDDALAWEDRLNRINDLFDVWIDVQRRWVYLEGIFTGSADIKHLLPNESQRFQRYFVCVCVSIGRLHKCLIVKDRERQGEKRKRGRGKRGES